VPQPTCRASFFVPLRHAREGVHPVITGIGGGYWIARSSRAMTRLAPLIPARKTCRIIVSPRPPKGRFREAREMRDGVRRLRDELSRLIARAAPGLRPGPLRGPARSWLTTCLLRDRASPDLSATAMACKAVPSESAARRPKNLPQKSMRLECCALSSCAQVGRSAVAHEQEAHVARREAPACSARSTNHRICASRRATPSGLAPRGTFGRHGEENSSRMRVRIAGKDGACLLILVMPGLVPGIQ